MQNNNTPDQEQALKQQILEYLHTGLLFQRNLNGLINWLEELKEGEPDQENHLPDTNVGDIGQGWKTVKSDGLPAVGTDGLSEWQECYAPFETTPAPTYAARKKEKEISDLKEIALKLGERVREAEEANERLKKRNAALHSFIDKLYTADQVRQMLGECWKETIVCYKELEKEYASHGNFDLSSANCQEAQQTTINNLLNPNKDGSLR